MTRKSGCDTSEGPSCSLVLKSNRSLVVRFELLPSDPATASLSPSSIKLGSSSSITFAGSLRNFPPNTELTARYTYTCIIPGCSGSGTLDETVTTDANGSASGSYTVTGLPTQAQICAAARLNPEYQQYLGSSGAVTVTFSGGGKQASASLTITLPTKADCGIR